jgi:FkbM family methyltransferase
MRGGSGPVAALRRGLKAVLGREVYAPVQLRVATEHHGSAYGGWSVCPEGLTADSVVYCAGVGEDVSFDLALVQRFGVRVHAFDPSPRSIAWVRGQAGLPAAFEFHAYGIGEADGTLPFYPPADPAHVSYSVLGGRDGAEPVMGEVRRLGSIMRELGHTHIDLLKMDVEGAEYGVIRDLVAERIPVRQLLVEFHTRFPGVGARTTREAIRTLNDAGWRIFAVSPSGQEYSFLHPGSAS